jgi:putative membrane protein
MELPADAKSTKDQLSGLSGENFDREFMRHMVSDHEKAVDLFRKEAQGGQDAQVKQFAQQTLPTLQDHLKQAQEVQGNLRKVAGTQSPEQQTAPAAGTTAQGTSSTSSTQEAARPSASGFAGMTAEDLIGQTVVNKNGDKVGKVDDIVLDANKKAVLAVISVGGFLGIGAKDVAVPFDELQPGDNKAILMSDATKDQLKAMPEYKKGQEGYSSYPPNQPIGGASQ